MYSKFEALSEDKKLRILNSAFKEFSNKVFKEASTEEIAKNAEISKGALFQYFGTKKQLYYYAYNYGYNLLLNEYWNKVDLKTTDIFERIKGIIKVKLGLFIKFPNLFEFIITAYTKETDKEIKNDIISKIDIQKDDVLSKIYSNIDYSKFKQEFDPKQVIDIIFFVLQGYSQREIDKIKNQKVINLEHCSYWFDQVDMYIETLKKAFYREDI